MQNIVKIFYFNGCKKFYKIFLFQNDIAYK